MNSDNNLTITDSILTITNSILRKEKERQIPVGTCLCEI